MPTKIEWTEETWNPIAGCSKVSPGCDDCYAIRQGARLQHLPVYTDTVHKPFGGPLDWTGQVNMDESHLDKPYRWTRERMILERTE